ncbi:RcnB family protein [Polaromonas hydrogenivorans]
MTTQIKKSMLLRSGRSFALVLAATLACTASFAEKPEWAGGGKGDKGGKHEQKAGNDHGNQHGNQQDNQRVEHAPSGQKSGNSPRAGNVRVGGYFGNQQRTVVRTYYGNEFKAGRCPPGLAKKHNGCMPPGQAKKYVVGQRLPRNVVYYPLPQRVVYQLGAPPSGYRYVRVSSDILLLAIGTSMVVDAIQNLSGY